MPSTTRIKAKLGAVLIVAAVMIAAGGCGGDRSGGPIGRPEDIVTQAPDRTLAARTATVVINAPAAAARGVVDLVARTGRLRVTDVTSAQPADVITVAGRSYAKRASDPGWTAIAATLPEALTGGDPFANLDLVRGTVHILSDGGAEVDGASTIRYTLTIDPQQAVGTTPPDRQAGLRAALQGRTALFMMDVWIDSKLLIRRVEVATDLRPTTPSTRDDRLPIAADVDYIGFGVAVGPIEAPLGCGDGFNDSRPVRSQAGVGPGGGGRPAAAPGARLFRRQGGHHRVA
jgi:hypothetical protein